MIKVFSSVAALLIAAACVGGAPLLSRQEAIVLSNAAAEREGIALSGYFAPEAKHKSSNQWFVSYRFKTPIPGGWFMVTVDEKTKATEITLGE